MIIEVNNINTIMDPYVAETHIQLCALPGEGTHPHITSLVDVLELILPNSYNGPQWGNFTLSRN